MILEPVFALNDYHVSRRNIRNAKAPTLMEYKEVLFDRALVRKNKMPKYLLRGKDEDYVSYLNRLNSFFTGFSQRELADVLAQIDSSEERYKPTVDYLMNLINQKSKKCVLI